MEEQRRFEGKMLSLRDCADLHERIRETVQQGKSKESGLRQQKSRKGHTKMCLDS